MSKITRLILVVFSFCLSVISLIAVFMLVSDFLLNSLIALSLRIQKEVFWRPALIVFFALLFISAITVLVIAIMNGRLRKARVRENALGTVDIGVEAIESIALNAAKSSQAGVRSAKARVSPGKGSTILVYLSVETYSDVDLPAMMAKVQERVKKDIERYTGIEVASVEIQVGRVDPIAARVER